MPPAARWLLVADGASVHTRRLASALSDVGLDIHLACFEGEDLANVTMHRLAGARGGDLRYALAVPGLRRLIARLRPDVVHAHYLSSYGLLAALARPERLVQTTWGTDVLVTARRPLRRTLARHALGRAVLATGDSQSLLDGIRAIDGTVATERFVFGPPRWVFDHRPPREPMVVSARNHESFYRVDVILEAWELARGRLPGHRLVVLGDGSLTPVLRQRAGEDVEFRGRLPHAEVLEVLCRSVLSVSIPDSDATSAAVLESLAAGTPVVASDLPANREWIPGARLVPPRPTPQELAEVLVATIGGPAHLDAGWSLEAQVAHLIDTVRHTT